MIIYIAKVFIYFLTLMFCCSIQANQLENYLKIMSEDIKQKKSVYAVSVTRTTQRNDETDYLPLTPSKRFIIFSILNCFLGNMQKDIFPQLKNIVVEEFQFAHSVQNKYEEHVKLLLQLKDSNFTQSQTEFIKNKTKKGSSLFKDTNLPANTLLIMGLNKTEQKAKQSISWPLNNKQEEELDVYVKNIETNAKKQALDTLTKEEVALMNFWKGKKESEVVHQYNELYSRIISTLNSSSQITKPTITNGNMAIVVFNEMFFGKNAPFYKGVIEKEITDNLSIVNKNKIFHINFLMIENKKFSDLEKLNSFIKENSSEDDSRFYTTVYKDYRDYLENGIQQYIKQSGGTSLRIVENVSKIYLNGGEGAFYNKSSYQIEDDDEIKKGGFYVFGKGVDKLSDNSTTLNFISTEICYDLELGVRSKYNLYPKDVLIHIVPSNTLAFRDDPKVGNMKHLPFQSYFILHVDPLESAFYKKIPSFSFTEGYLLKFHKIGDGMCSYIYQFTLDESTYNIKIWDLSSLL